MHNTLKGMPGAAILAMLLLFSNEGLSFQRTTVSIVSCQNLLETAVRTPALILNRDRESFRQTAHDQQLIILLIAPNPASLKYSEQRGYLAKTSELKRCKSGAYGRNAGLVKCPPDLFATLAEWKIHKLELEANGFTILGAEDDYLVRDSNGYFYHSDYDLLGVYDLSSGRPAYSEAFRATLNANLGRALVRHGPLDEYDLRDHVGVKFPVLAFIPNGTTVNVQSLAELRAVYYKYGIACPW